MTDDADEARRLRETLDSIDEGFVLVDPDWRIRDINKTTQAIDGRPAARIIGRDFFETWPATLGQASERAYRAAMTSRRPAVVRHDYVDARHDLRLVTRIFPSGEGLALFTRDITAQVRAEERLREAEASAAVAVRAARLGTWNYDPRTGELLWDERHRELFGLAPEVPVDYEMFLDAVHPDDRALVRTVLAEGTDPLGTGDLAVEYRCLGDRTGRERWLAARGRAQFEHGACVRVTGVVQDITERRRGQAILEESEARFRAITEATPMIVFVTDAAGANTYTNPQFSEFTGLPPSALLGDGWTVVLHPDDRARTTAAWRGAVATGAAYDIEFRLRRHDGAFRWFLARGIALRGLSLADHAEGLIEQWLGTCTDIQELVEARLVLARDRDELEHLVADRTAALHASLRRLHDSEARLRAVFENSSDYLLVFRIDALLGPVYLDLNDKAEAALGRSRSDVIGLTPRQVLGDGAMVDDIERQFAAALAAHGLPHRYTSRRSYDGTIRDIDAVALAFDGPGGERLLLLTSHDVTEQRALEEALRQSQKMEAVGQLTGGIAHDFNNLLAGISGNLELLRGRAEEGRLADVDRHAATALASVQRAAALTHRLLAFARRQPLDPRAADLNRLVAGMEEMIRRTAGPAITVETILADGLWTTLCDANQLENALLNLCINARDAMPDGGRLVIETANAELDAADCAGQQDARPGQYASIAVTDSGVGMSADVVARAFEPFFTTKPIGQGTGLGLSMLYGFVRQSDGHVRIVSAPGRGSTVRLYLPRHGGAAAPEPQPRKQAAPGRPDDGKTILVVEDEPVVRMLAVEVVEGLGHIAAEAADGPAALRLLESMPPIDLLLTDVGLPGMNGRQLADAARERQPGLKVLFMTGYAHNAAIGGGLMAPGMEMLAKPFALEALSDKLRTMLAVLE